LLHLALLVAGIALVVAGAELFFDGLMATAARLGVSPFVLTVVVSGFELENLAAGVAANAKGLGNAAAGTFLGGTTFLALAVPGLAAAFAPLRSALPARILLWTAVAPLPLLALALDGTLERWEGGVLVVWFVVAIVGMARSGRGLVGEEPPKRARFALARLVLGLGVLAGAGDILGRGIYGVVHGFGIPESLLGNTAIAASVEAEEVGRVVTPARRGRGDVALGNVVGTIAHFAAFNAGVIALVRPIRLDHASRVLHLPVAAAAPILLAALVAWRGGVGRAVGALLLALYAAYVAVAVVLAF
jgi:cation:H+ antiporter